jgi:hypothetical protein
MSDQQRSGRQRESAVPPTPGAADGGPDGGDATSGDGKGAAADAARDGELPEDRAFPVVGIGASAGGVAAFEAFFSGMPADSDTGMAFVLVQHLSPDHKSLLRDLVKRYTRMQVYEVEDGMRVEPDSAYIIPPNRDMAFVDGTRRLLEPSEPRGLRLPIDFFLRSLAQDQHERGICIVLSGTGSDGTLGVRAIKGEGGMAMAQDPETTEHGRRRGRELEVLFEATARDLDRTAEVLQAARRRRVLSRRAHARTPSTSVAARSTSGAPAEPRPGSAPTPIGRTRASRAARHRSGAPVSSQLEPAPSRARAARTRAAAGEAGASSAHIA